MYSKPKNNSVEANLDVSTQRSSYNCMEMSDSKMQ